MRKAPVRADRDPGLLEPRAEGTVPEVLGRLHHDRSARADAGVHGATKPQPLTGLEVGPDLIGLHLAVHGAGEEMARIDRGGLQIRELLGRQLARVRRDDHRGPGRQILCRFGGVRDRVHLQIGEVRVITQREARRELRPRGAVCELRPGLYSEIDERQAAREGVAALVHGFGTCLEVEAACLTRTGLGGTPHLRLLHDATLHDRDAVNRARHAVEERPPILPGHLDRVAGARAAAAVGRVFPGDRLANAACKERDLGVHELARHRARRRGWGGRAARGVRRADGEGRSNADVATGRRPPDDVVERDLSNRGGLLERGRVRTRHGSLGNRQPFVLGRRPLLQGAPVNLGDDEALGSLAQEMRRRQFDGLPARSVEHHRPQAVDRDLQARRGARQPNAVLDHGRDIMRSIGKPRRLEQPRARLGVALHLPYELAVDRHVHQPAGLRDSAERGGGVRRLAITPRAGIRQRSKDQRRSRRRCRPDRDGKFLGECSNRARSGDRTDRDRMHAGTEGGLGGHRVGPLTIDDRHHGDAFSVDPHSHLACSALHAARQRGGAVGGQVVDHGTPSVALIREVGEPCTHAAGVEHRPRLELLCPKLQVGGCLATAAAA